MEQRFSDLKENQKRMVSTLTNRFKESVVIDKILINNETGNQSSYIFTDPEIVKTQTAEYYKKAFGKRNTNFANLSDEWKKQYNPIARIEDKWYNEILTKSTPQELKDIFKSLPNDKASGPSGISYEMFKKMRDNSIAMFVDFINLCFSFGTMPPTWKKSNIYPIPKNNDWCGDLSNTRPIILIETARKILTKILTLRLAAVCKNHEILKGPNFAGLPGESTSEPIHLINNICEEARETKKELWILFQDTAKAFDTVNLEMLEKAMQHIKVPPKAISLISNLFKDRELKVITKLGLTDSIQAGDGIDQGETISPLLW